MLHTVWMELRYGFRALRRNPGFGLAAVMTLALGIGANTAIFTVVDAVLLRPLPYRAADRLVFVWSTWVSQGIPFAGSAMPDYREWRDRSQTVEGLAAFTYADVNLSGSGEAERLQAVRVTANLFGTLGVTPALGRAFTAGEEAFGAHRVAILSDRVWQRRFGGDRSVLGRSLTLNGEPHVVVGVLPAGLPFFDDDPRIDVWTPLAFRPGDVMDSRSNHFVTLVGHLRPGVTLARAQEEFGGLAHALEAQFPENKGLGTLVALVGDQLTRDVRDALLVLAGAVGFVLLVACVNVASLLLARAAARQRELAIRASLGAGRLTLVRQLTLESVPLGLFGAGAALPLATWGVRALDSQLPTSVPRFNAIALNGRVLAFTAGVACLTALLFGLLPALQATRRRQMTNALNEGGRGGSDGPRRARLRRTLVVAEIALALVLLAGAGLMMRSFARLRAVDLGFVPDHLLTMRVPLPDARYPIPGDTAPADTNGGEPAALRWFEELLMRVRTLPGVRAAGVTTKLPLGFGNGWGKYVTVIGGAAPPARSLADVPLAQFTLVSPGYFEAAGLTLRRGRAFTDRDTGRGQPVAIVNDTLARRFFPNQDPIGRTLRMAAPDALIPGIDAVPIEDRAPTRVIVGVVADIKGASLRTGPQPEVYAPYTQFRGEGWFNTMSLAVRSQAAPADLAASVRAQIRALDPDQPVTFVSSAHDLVGRRLAQPRFSTLLLALFAALGLVLAAVGIFGVIAHLVTLRTHEVGIRVALGAQRRDVLRLVLGEGLKLTTIGVALGLVAAILVAPVLRTQLFGVTTMDVPTFAAVACVLVAIAMLACYLPARRAMHIDPIVALRHD